MDRELKLRVIFGALDKLSGPIERISGASRKLGSELGRNRKQLKSLEQAQDSLDRLRGLRLGLADTEVKSAEAHRELERLSREIGSAENPTRKLQQEFKKASEASAKLSGEARRQRTEIGRLETTLDQAGYSADDMVSSERRLRTEIDRTTREIEEQQRQLKRMGRAREQVVRMRDVGGRMQSGGAQAMVAGGAALTALALPVKGAATFQGQLTDIAQKANLTRAEGEKLGRTFDALGPKVAQLPTKLAEGVDVLSGFGLDPRQATQMIEPIGRAATAYKAEIADLSAATFSTVDNLKVPIAQTAKALDIMAMAGKEGAFEIKDMAQHFPALTASSQALGQTGVSSVADLAAALQITRKGAGDAGTAANNLQNLLNKINTKDTIGNFKKFGVDLPAALKKAAAEGKTPIEAIAELTREATGGDLSKLSFLFADQQVQAALRPLIQNMDLYREIRAKALAANGTVEADFAERMEDAGAKFQKLAATGEALGHRMGNALLPTISTLMDKFTALGERIGAWADRNPELMALIAKFAATVGVLLLVLGALAVAVGTVLGPLAVMRFAFMGAAPVLAKIGGALKLVSSGFLFLGKAALRAGMMMMANPMIALVVAIVAAIAIAAYLIYTHWDTIKATFDTAIAWLGTAWQWIKAKLSAFPALFGPLGMVAALVIRHWGAIKGGFQAGWENVKAFFSSLPDQMKTIGKAIITGLLTFITPGALTNRLLSVARRGVTAFKEFFGIRSPSRLFMEMGGFLTSGLARGIDRGGDEPLDRIGRLARGLAGGLAVTAAAPALALGSPTTLPDLAAQGRAAIARGDTAIASARAASPAAQRAASGPTPFAASPITITINQQPGQSGEDLARLVAQEIERARAREAAARRSSYDDEV